jgi:SAM-dependent methyltransferase
MDFDQYAPVYDRDLLRGLCLSGESPEWFATRRIAIVRDWLESQGRRPTDIMDFGCGTGNHIPILADAFPQARITGIDISTDSLELARQQHHQANVRFCTPDDCDEPDLVDLIYINGVFHHIPPADHAEELARCRRLLKPGGVVACFDNNPFSLPARVVMSRIPFDRDAVMVNPYRFRRLMTRCGFTPPQLRFHFVFPRILSPLRPLEEALACCPLGAQFSLIAVNAPATCPPA